MEPIPPIAMDSTMALGESKDGIVHCLVSDDSAPRVRIFRQSVRSLRRIRTVQSEGDPNNDCIIPPIPLENVSPRTRHRLLRILRTNSLSNNSESQDSDGLPSIRSLAHCSLPQASKENIPCFSMMVDENPFCADPNETLKGGEDRSTISSMSPDSARLYFQNEHPGGMLHAFPPVEIFVQRQRISTDEWQDSWIRGVGPSPTPIHSGTDQPAETHPMASLRPPPIVTVVDMQITPDPPPAPKHKAKNDDGVEMHFHPSTEDMNISPVTLYARPIVPATLALPTLSPLSPSTTTSQRPQPTTTQNRSKTTSHMVRRPVILQSSARMIRKPPMVQKAQTSPQSKDTTDVALANDPLIGQLPRRRDPATATSVFSFGSIVGESTMITPMSLGSSESSSSSFNLTERRSPRKSIRRHESVLPSTPLRLPVSNVEIRENDADDDHPMKVFETFIQSDHPPKKTLLQNDLDYYWRQTKRLWYPSEKPVALQRNRSGCLT